MTSYLTASARRVPGPQPAGPFRPFGIPLLEDIPIVGPLLFDNTIYVYLMFAAGGAA